MPSPGILDYAFASRPHSSVPVSSIWTSFPVVTPTPSGISARALAAAKAASW